MKRQRLRVRHGTIADAFKAGAALFPIAVLASGFSFFVPVMLEPLLENTLFIGLAITLTGSTVLMFNSMLGVLSDRIGKKRGVLLGLGIYTVAVSFFFLFNNLPALIASMLFAYMGRDLYEIAAKGYLAEEAGKRKYNKHIAVFHALYGAGYVFGPPLAVFIVYSIAPEAMFSFGLFAGALSAMAALFWRPDQVWGKTAAKRLMDIGGLLKIANRARAIKKLVKSAPSIPVGLFACALWDSTMVVGIPLLFLVTSESLMDAALVAAAFILPFVFVDYFLTSAANTVGLRRKLLVGGFVAGGLLTMVFSFSSGVWVLAVVAALTTIAVDSAWIVLDIEAGLFVDTGREAETQAAFIATRNAGYCAGPLVTGGLMWAFGPSSPFLVVGAFLVLLGLTFKIKELK